MNEPEIKSSGETWQYLWHDLGIAVGFELLRERSDGLHGELWVGSERHGGTQNGHIVWGTFNLSSPTARARMATALASRPAGASIKPAVWTEMLEYACVLTAQQFREGEPLVDLSEGDAVLKVQYLAKPLLPLGEITAMYADGESGKSMLALALCLSLRLGQSIVPGVTVERQANSLYLDWETSADVNRRRQEYLCRGAGLSSRPPLYYRHMTRPLADEIASVKHQAERIGAALIVVDSAGPATGADVRDSDPAMRLMTALRQLTGTPLVLGHVSKATASQRGSDRGRMIGSVFYELLARCCWELRADSDTQPVVVGFFHRKANLGPKQRPFGLKLHFEDEPTHRAWFSACDVEESPLVAEHAPLSDRMVAALRRGPRTTDDLAEDLGVSQATMRATLNRAAKKAVVVQLPTGNGKGGRGNQAAWGLAASGGY